MDIQQILQIGKRCAEEQNAPCTEACPLHIDIRTMLKHVKAGKWDSAFRLYQKQTVFPYILSRFCDAPCQNACIRSASGDGLELSLLERAICDYADNPLPQSFAVPRKDTSIAIVGAGLTGLTAAVLLAGSGYHINLYEKTSRMGGRLWETDESLLPRPLLQVQMELVTMVQNISIRLETEIRSVEECAGNARILAIGSRDQAFSIVATGESPNDRNFWLRQMGKGVILAGENLSNSRFSPAASIAAGKLAAKFADWYLKGMKTELFSDARQNGTSLTPNTGDLMPENAVKSAEDGRYTREEARKEAERCLTCHCLRCVNACELLKQGRAYPKKYLNDIYQSLNLVEKFSESICKRQIYSCNLCNNCKSVCPEAVDMGEAYLEARRTLYEKCSLPPAFHEFYLNDMLFSNGEASLTLPGIRSNRYLFFPGCRLGAFLPHTVEAAYEFLNDRLQGQVAIHLGCCGAPAYWAGREDLHSEVIEAFRNKWNTLGRPEVILACPSCAKIISQYAPEIPRKMLWELFCEIGMPEGTQDLHGQEYAVFDPCSASEDLKQKSSVRELLQSLGVILTPMNEIGGCCGYGGLISYSNPKLKERIVQRRISQSEAEYVTYCVNCRDEFLLRGKPTRHILELLFQETEDMQIPSLSRQRENRRLLALRLQGLTAPENQEIPIQADPGITEKLDQQFILLEQVYRAIVHCEHTGCLIRNEESNTLSGNYQEGATTYWVEYRRTGDQYQIVNAYSHHMELIDNS